MKLSIGSNTIERIEKPKFLGVKIDHMLKYDKHVKEVCSKINRKANLISRKFYLFDTKFKTTLFKLFLLPYFDYCSTLFSDISIENLNKLSKCYTRNIKLFLKVSLHGKNNEEQSTALTTFDISL